MLWSWGNLFEIAAFFFSSWARLACFFLRSNYGWFGLCPKTISIPISSSSGISPVLATAYSVSLMKLSLTWANDILISETLDIANVLPSSPYSAFLFAWSSFMSTVFMMSRSAWFICFAWAKLFWFSSVGISKNLIPYVEETKSRATTPRADFIFNKYYYQNNKFFFS